MKNHNALLAVLYFPIFGPIIVSPYNVRFYLLIYVSLIILLLLPKGDTDRYFLHKVALLFTFSILFMLLVTVLEVIHGTQFLLIIRQSLTYVIVIGIILFLSKYKKEALIKILERTFYFVGIMFILQFILSAYESMNNIFLVNDYNWALSGLYVTSLDNRFILKIFDIDTGFLRVFTHPFSGLLGQHNYWAVQLPFYNLIFLIMYHKTKMKYYLFLIILVFIAILLNTTRAGILIILMTDIFYVLYLNKRKIFTYYAVSFLTILLLVYVIPQLAVNFFQYFQQTDTLTGRIESYSIFYWNIFTGDFPILFGYGSNQVIQIMNNLMEYNFESAFFTILYVNGLIGLALFMIFLVKIVTQGRKFSFINKYFSYLIVFNIVGISLTIQGVLGFYAFQFVALVYIYNVISDPTYNEAEAV